MGENLYENDFNGRENANGGLKQVEAAAGSPEREEKRVEIQVHNGEEKARPKSPAKKKKPGCLSCFSCCFRRKKKHSGELELDECYQDLQFQTEPPENWTERFQIVHDEYTLEVDRPHDPAIYDNLIRDNPKGWIYV